MATTKEREARSYLELNRDREGGRVRLPGPAPKRAPGRRAPHSAEARAKFVRRVRSYLEVPRG